MDVTSAVLCFLRTYSVISRVCNAVGSFFHKVYRICLEDSQPTYILFENIMHPYNASCVTLTLAASAIPDWYYKPDENILVQWTFPARINTKAPPFPRLRSTILSMEILENDRVVFDLTDFLGKMEIYGERMPCVQHIIGAWYASSSIVLDTTSPYVVRHITETAETVLTPLPYVPAPSATAAFDAAYAAAAAAGVAADADAADADAADADADAAPADAAAEPPST